MASFRRVCSFAGAVMVVLIYCSSRAEACEDEDYCDGLEDWCSDEQVKGWCPKMCGECAPTEAVATTTTATTQPPCEDKHVKCDEWLEYCETSDWMEKNCKKSCKFCGAGGWSECTKTCGAGSRYKEECDEGECEFVYEVCATNECQTTNCNHPQERRYGLPHACCGAEQTQPQCGQPYVNARVRGGENAKQKQWSWMVAISMTNNEFCAGVLISNTFLLSAAHCFMYRLGRLHNTVGWKLHTGLLRLSKAGRGIEIKKVTVHSEYSFPTNDIAIIELKEAVTFSAFVQPICLPGGEITPYDSTCYVTGWGISDHSAGGTTDHLQEAAIKNLDRRICQKVYRGADQNRDVMSFLDGDKGYLCAGSLYKRVDSCSGDSGGPLLCQRCSSCTWYVAGLVSFGNTNCATIGVPAVYTEVREHENWIANVTGTSHPVRSCSNTVGP